MTFINLSLLFGVGLAAIPVALHLMMRSRPKKIEFPALRLLESRRTANARRMKLRHLLLLLLRMSVLLAAVLALTRPSLPPARYGLSWYEWLLLFAVMTVSAVAYRWLAQRAAAQEAASFLVRERIANLRARAALVGLLAILLFVGIPWGMRLRAEVRSKHNEVAADIPVAAVFAFDTSVSMSYRHESLTRLEKAKRIATDHLQNLPQGSRVAVTGSTPANDIVFQADLAGAQSRIESLRTESRVETINRILRRTVAAHREDQQRVRDELGTSDKGDLFSREVFIFTDLSRNAWTLPDDSGLRDLLVEYGWLHVFLVDVSVARPVNLALRNLTLSGDSVGAGRSVDLSVDVERTDAAQNSANIEVVLLDDQGEESRPAAPVLVQLESVSARTRMVIPVGEGSEYLSGLVRITSSDPLKADDTVYFSLGVQTRPRLLLVADSISDADYLHQALLSHEGGPSSKSHYDCTFVPTSRLNTQPLDSFDVVCLVNCQRPKRDDWESLQRWVDKGGALLTVVGGAQRAVADAWCGEESDAVLPAQLLVPLRYTGPPRTLKYETGHPITRVFDYDREARTELLGVAIRRRWKVQPAGDARVIMSYTGNDSSPALLERRVGKGRSLMLTTAVDYTTVHAEQWNELPVNWTFIMLADGMIQYLTGATEQRRNFESGSPIEIQLPADRQFEQYILRRPGPRQTVEQLEPEQRSVLIDDADDPGHYRLMSPQKLGSFRSEFAVNMGGQETDLTPVTPSDLDTLLGDDRFSVVRNPSELEKAVREGRLGIEVFPVLLGFLVILFCSEHLMANYFYDQEAVAGGAE